MTEAAVYPRKIKVRTMSDEQKESLRSWLQIAINLLVVIGSALAGWSFNQTLSLRSEVDTMKASQFTAANGLEVWKEIATIKQAMAVLPTKTDVERIEVRQREISERLIRIEEAVTRKNG